ncbi:PH domain-containing protein [Paenibacillus elgii]
MRTNLDGRIDQNALKVWRLTAFTILSPLIPILAALLLLSFLANWPLWIFMAVLAMTAVAVLLQIVIIPQIRYKRWSYEISEQVIELYHGIWSLKRTLIPMVRIQHVDMKQGPLLRRYGLATVTFATAAGSHRIPALPEQKADRIRQQIAAYAEVFNEDL